jgi:hypothetical protein
MIRTAQSIKPKLGRCKECGVQYEKRTMRHVYCSPPCLFAAKKKADEKKARADYKRRKEALKTRKDYENDLQVLVNRFCRLRDAAEPCISCCRHHRGQYHAGHYKSVGAHPELRFDEFNINKQCKPCNVDKSGNILEYRKGLIAKHGIEKVEELEGYHPPLKLAIGEIELKIAAYRKKVKQLQEAAKEAASAC